ncbi:sugar MFS transporter [Dyella sedimenti]|uniref:sugar MFS transporter n=1 Tax=Dyella sedimenti TaxID=2919947 RepID=UPI001FAA421B|nr:sugar MFS transporter [Dyella sedimenti]
MSSITPTGEAPHPSSLLPMTIIGVLFFTMGFFTWLNGPLISFVKVAFTLDDVNAFLVPFAFYLSYFVLALPAGAVLKRTGMKRGMALGLFVMAIGAAVFGQFVRIRVYPGSLTGLFVIGAGLSLLQTAANPYISILGPIDSAARRIALMGICNKFAGALAPLAFGALVMSGIDAFLEQATRMAASPARESLLDAFAARVFWPYLGLAGLLVALAAWILLSPLPDVKAAEAKNENPARGQGGIFGFPHLWLGVLCLFLYVGVEVMAGDAINTYGQGFGLPLRVTSHFTTYTMFAMLAGYLFGSAMIPRFISQQRYLAVSAVLGVLFAIGAFVTHGLPSVAFVAALGFANAMMWPAIFPLAIKGLGGHTEQGSALLVMGIVGGALVPQVFVHLKQHVDFQLSFALVTVPCYLYILYYGMRGHAAGTR